METTENKWTYEEAKEMVENKDNCSMRLPEWPKDKAIKFKKRKYQRHPELGLYEGDNLSTDRMLAEDMCRNDWQIHMTEDKKVMPSSPKRVTPSSPKRVTPSSPKRVTPIQVFRNKKALQDCAKYYVDLLGLQDWCIVYRIQELPDEAGNIDANYTSKSCIITLNDGGYDGKYFKQPQELVLIHELLHCKYAITYEHTIYESRFVADAQHQLLDDMARAIFKARYNLTNKYFIKEV